MGCEVDDGPVGATGHVDLGRHHRIRQVPTGAVGADRLRTCLHDPATVVGAQLRFEFVLRTAHPRQQRPALLIGTDDRLAVRGTFLV